MKAKIIHQCREEPGVGADLVTIEIDCEMPFVPHPGMYVSPSEHSDFLKVADVYWKAMFPDHLTVYIQPPVRSDLLPLSYWRRSGWRVSK